MIKWKSKLLQFKSNNMKSINQFDYPSKEAQSFKANSQISDSQDKKDQIKARYKQNLHYHMELQRNKAKQNQKLKKEQESKRKKQQLESELEKKKRQLQNLQILKVQAEENQKKAYELAVLKQEQDRIKKQEEKRRKLQFDEDATIRFSQAMKRLHEEKEQQSFKERLAQQRRKTAQQFQKVQRAKAEKYRSSNEQKNIEKQNQTGADEYRKTFKQFFTSPNQDYNRTCIHNLKVVSEIKKEQENAFERGKIQDDEIRQRSEERRRQKQENDRRSKERGKDALLKIQREKQYQSFEKETTEQQKRYNLQRIEAGKKNQFVGIKPTTLSQMQIGKKMRSEEQFDKMFYSKSVQPAENVNKPATKYEIVEKRIPQKQDEENISDEKPRKIKSYLKHKQESEIPAVSEGKYSFEQQQCFSEFKNQSRSQSNIHQETQQNEEEQYEQSNLYQRTNMKNALKETRIPDQRSRNSPEQSRNAHSQGIKEERSFKKEIHKPKEKEQSEAFDTDAMLRKYGLNKESSEKEKAGKGKQQPKGQGKRKVVELANICQNRQPEKQELNYSSESQEDSLS